MATIEMRANAAMNQYPEIHVAASSVQILETESFYLGDLVTPREDDPYGDPYGRHPDLFGIWERWQVFVSFSRLDKHTTDNNRFYRS